ncbi:MAG: hypothetical protein ACREQL_15230, partial [Candidatus Binatia bacterium]
GLSGPEILRRIMISLRDPSLKFVLARDNFNDGMRLARRFHSRGSHHRPPSSGACRASHDRDPIAKGQITTSDTCGGGHKDIYRM